MKVAICGTGYVGLVSGVCLASFGHEVRCIDTDSAKIAQLKQGNTVIFEPGLGRLMQENDAAGRLSFTTDVAQGCAGVEVVFLAVGTPPHPQTGEADLRYIFAAAEQIAPHLPRGAIVVTKSTVPVGTNQQLQAVLDKTAPEKQLIIASNPEFLREGSAVEDFLKPSRVVIGCQNPQAGEKLKQLYHPLTLNHIPVITTSLETAEMAKYAANSFLATKVAFINEIADLCEALGANVQDIALTMGLDDRIGRKFLSPGPGIGGSCFPKDTRALQHTARQEGIPFRILDSVIEANDRRKRQMAERILAHLTNPSQAVIGILGITFKQNTDDVRESPALRICEYLLAEGCTLRIYDPQGIPHAKAHFSAEARIHWASSAQDAATGANALAILTEWDEFKSLDLPALRDAMTTPTLIDLRNLYLPDSVRAAGFTYDSIGRPQG